MMQMPTDKPWFIHFAAWRNHDCPKCGETKGGRCRGVAGSHKERRALVTEQEMDEERRRDSSCC